MRKKYIFCDASVNQKIGIGFGAYLILNQEEIANFSQKKIKEKVQNVKFQSTSLLTPLCYSDATDFVATSFFTNTIMA